MCERKTWDCALDRKLLEELSRQVEMRLSHLSKARQRAVLPVTTEADARAECIWGDDGGRWYPVVKWAALIFWSPLLIAVGAIIIPFLPFAAVGWLDDRRHVRLARQLIARQIVNDAMANETMAKDTSEWRLV